MTPEQRRDFGRYIEQCKRSSAYGSGARGDATEEELRQMAKEFMEGFR